MRKNGRTEDYTIIWVLFGILCVLTGAVLAACIFFAKKIPEIVGRNLTNEERAQVIERNSPLTDYIFLTSVADFPRKDSIRKITVHHMADDISLERLGEVFAQQDRRASANYAIDREGRVALYVEESNRAWTSSSRENDHQAVTIEVANDEIGGSWHVSDASYESLIDLCTDICRRNGIAELTFTGDAKGNLTIHKMFRKDTECPGPYLESKMPEIAEEVNKRLQEPENQAKKEPDPSEERSDSN